MVVAGAALIPIGAVVFGYGPGIHHDNRAPWGWLAMAGGLALSGVGLGLTATPFVARAIEKRCLSGAGALLVSIGLGWIIATAIFMMVGFDYVNLPDQIEPQAWLYGLGAGLGAVGVGCTLLGVMQVVPAPDAHQHNP